MDKIASFDVGGTSIKCGLLNFDGDILEIKDIPTPKENCKENIPKLISEQTNDWNKDGEVRIVGVSTAGNIDAEKGIVIYASNFSDYSGAEISKTVKKDTGLNCFIENDVNSAAIGEAALGAGKNEDNFVCITIGTSIGGAIFIEGELFKGSNGLAGEIGHMTIKKDGSLCDCGRIGCYQNYASTNALIKMYKDETGDDVHLNGKEIIQKVKDNEHEANLVFNKFLDDLAIGLVNIGHILDPSKIIIGGGISEAGDILFNPLREKYNNYCIETYKNKNLIVPAKLGNNAGIIGAAFNAKKIWENRRKNI